MRIFLTDLLWNKPCELTFNRTIIFLFSFQNREFVELDVPYPISGDLTEEALSGKLASTGDLKKGIQIKWLQSCCSKKVS